MDCRVKPGNDGGEAFALSSGHPPAAIAAVHISGI